MLQLDQRETGADEFVIGIGTYQQKGGRTDVLNGVRQMD